MAPALCPSTAPVPPPSYHRARARRAASPRITALTLVTAVRLLDLCRLTIRAAHRRCPPPLPVGLGGRPARTGGRACPAAPSSASAPPPRAPCPTSCSSSWPSGRPSAA
jgi:hypothetical protein